MLSSQQKTERVRPVDLELLRIMQVGQDYCVCELTESLGVTATAIRQRIDRLLRLQMLQRTKRVSGRGRPTFEYQITAAGQQACGADSSKLTEAIWQAVTGLDDPAVRDSILQRAAISLGKRYAAALNQEPILQDGSLPCVEHSIGSKLASVSEAMQAQSIQASVVNSGDLPVLDITSCPYPSLSSQDADRSMCKLEEKMLSEALGTPMQLSSCRLDGDSCCQFSPQV